MFRISCNRVFDCRYWLLLLSTLFVPITWQHLKIWGSIWSHIGCCRNMFAQRGRLWSSFTTLKKTNYKLQVEILPIDTPKSFKRDLERGCVQTQWKPSSVCVCVCVPCERREELFFLMLTFLFKTNHLISQDNPQTLVSFGSHWNYFLFCTTARKEMYIW